MRNLNFLRKSERKSVGTTLALTVGSPSAHRRYSALKHLAFMLLFLLGSLNVWGGEATLDAVSTKEVVTTAGGTVSKEFDGVTCLIKRNSSNQPGFYTSSGIVRYYSTDVMTLSVASGNTITKIEFNMNSGAVGTASPTGLSSNTWTGNAESVSFTGSATVKINSITVTYTTGGGSTPSISVTPASWDFGNVASSDAASKEFSVSGSNLTAGILTISVPEGFSVSPNSISVTEATLAATAVTVSKKTTDINDYSGNLSFSGCGLAEAKTVALEMSVVADPEPTGTFAPFSGDIAEGDYLIIADGAGMNTTVSGNRLQYEELTKTGGNYVNPSTSLIWHIAASATDGYWTIYNDKESKYAAATSSNNQAQMLESGTDNKSLWSITHSGANYTITNKSNSRYLKKNGTYGFACYADGTVTLYKKALPKHFVIFNDAPTGTVAVSVGGSDISSGDQVEEGATVTITPAPSQYYRLVSVTKGEQAIEPVQGVYSFTMPSSDVAIAATFEYIPVTGLTLNKTELELLVDAEDALSVTAVAPADAYNGVTWASDDEGVVMVDENGAVLAIGEGTATITATSVVSGTVTATCAVTVSAPSGHKITITSANGSVTANTGVNVEDVLKDVAVVLTATPNDGYSISGWTVVGAEYSVSPDKTTCSFTMPDDEVLIEVAYTHEVAVLKLHDAAGVTEFDGDHFWKEEVTLPTSAAACSKTFVGWSANAECATAPELGATYVLPNIGDNDIYAVYAEAEEGEATWDEITAVPTAGTYAICSESYFLKAGISNNRFENGTATPAITNNQLTTAPASDCIWEVSINAGGKFLMKNGNNYAAATGTKNQGALITDATDTKAQWTIEYNSGFVVTNVANAASSINAVLRNNTTNGWATYAATTGSAPRFFKKNVGEPSYSNYSTACQQQAAAPTFSVAAGTYYVGQSVELACTTDGATIHYTLDGTEPTTSSATYSAAISLSERAITTIKAIAVAEGHENSAVAEAEYNINLPYDFAEFAALTQKENGKEYVVRGIISQKDAFNTQYNEIPYYISATGSTEGQIKCHNGLGLNKVTFTSADDINLGDNVTVVGTWSTQYSNLGAGNWMLEYTARVHDSFNIEGELTASSFDNGDPFDAAILDNLTVKETFTNGYYENVAGVTFNAGEKAAWADSDTKLIVNAVLNEATIATKEFDVTVSSALLKSIALKTDDENYQTKVVYYLGEAFVAPTIIATLDDESRYEAVATLVSGFDNENAGVQEVTVSYTRGAVTKTTSYNITMKAIFNTLETAYDASEAKTIIETIYNLTTESSSNMYVRGIVVSDADDDGTYYISDDGTATNKLQVYKGKYFASNVSAKGNIKAGDAVVIKGHIQVYSNAGEVKYATVLSQLREGSLAVGNVAAFEVGTADLAEADLTINRNGSNGAITFSCEENDALEVVENGIKLRAKGEAEANVTVTATMEADNTEGQINFTDASTTFTVHVVPAKVRYAVTFNLDEGSADPTPSLGDQLEGANVEIPAGTYTKDGYKFNGWAVMAGETPVAVTETAGVYSFTMPAANVTVTAQWVEGSDFTWDASQKGYTNAQDIATATVEADPISIVFAKETASNGPKYYTSGTAVRTYAGNTVTIATKSDTKLINKITFTYGDKNVVADGLSEDKLTWTGLAKEVVLTTSGGQAHYKTINVTYINGTVTTLSIANIAMKKTDAATAIVPVCNVDPTPAIAYSGYDTELITIENGTVAPTGTKTGNTTVTAIIAQGSNYTGKETTFTVAVADKTIPVMSFPQGSYNANLGESFTAPTLTKPEGVSVAYSSNNAAVSVDENTGAITLNAEGTAVITATSVENEEYSVGTATYTLNVIDPNKDVLTASKIGKTSYEAWSKKTFGSSVEYAGYNTTGGGDKSGSIQMNANPGGIVTTSAIGYLKSLSATAHTGNTKALEIYAKGTAYASSADLYSSDASVKGEKIGTIAAAGGAMVFEEGKAYGDNYKYIGIKSVGGAVYYDDITITWTPAEFASFAVTYKAGEATGDDVVESIEEGSLISLKAADTFEAPEGKMFAGWLLEGEENAREAGSKFTVTEAATFVAQWINIYTITYLPGEAAGDPVVVENVPIGNYELAANTFTAPESKEFAGWKLNNEGEALEAGSNYNVTGNASFTAQWSIIKQPAGLAYTTTSYMITRGRSFEAPELTNPYSLAVTYSGNNDEVATVNATTGAITLKGVVGEVTVTATSAETDYYYAGEASYTLKVKDANLSGGWVRLTNANTLVAGMKVIVAQHVASGTAIKTMGEQKTNNRGIVAGSLEDGTLVADEGTEILTLVAIKNTTNFALKTTDNKYLFAAGSGSGKNYLKSQANVDGNATWAISLSADGKATIIAQGTNTNNKMQYNQASTLFACYSGTQQDIALYSKTIAVSEGEMDASTLEEYADVVVEDGATLVINAGTKPLGNITGNVEVNAPLQAEGVHLGVNNTMEVNSTVNVPSFSISVKLGSTGQATNVNVTGSGSIAAPEGYVDMELADGANPDHWHSFTVPFEVDAINGIYDAETGAKLANEVNYAIMDYHGDIRANGDYGWKKYRGTLQPGVFYLITIDGESKVLRFMKKEGSNYIAENNMEMTYYDGAGASTDFGWCGVGNQNMFNGYVPQTYVAQVLNAAGTGYEAIDNTQAMSACIPFFIQVNVTVNLIMNTSAPSLAPRRMPAKGVERMKVFFGNENYTDKLYISASEEATNEYEIGKDLLKMTMTNTPSVPQIFGKAYGNKLCMIDAPMVNDQATYGLTLYAPAAGEYTISAPAMDNADLYLTLNGAIIWNLSMGEYTNDFAKGNNEGYGLLLVKKAPQVTTGVENAEANETGVQKVIINEHVYILRAEQMYDVTGKLVK